MANEKNLTPMNERSESEARELGRIGGIASGESRKKKKELSRVLKNLLDTPYQNTEGLQKDYPTLEIKEIDVRTALAIKMIDSALNGNIKAFDTIFRLTSEDKPLSVIIQHEPRETVDINEIRKLKQILEADEDLVFDED